MIALNKINEVLDFFRERFPELIGTSINLNEKPAYSLVYQAYKEFGETWKVGKSTTNFFQKYLKNGVNPEQFEKTFKINVYRHLPLSSHALTDPKFDLDNLKKIEAIRQKILSGEKTSTFDQERFFLGEVIFKSRDQTIYFRDLLTHDEKNNFYTSLGVRNLLKNYDTNPIPEFESYGNIFPYHRRVIKWSIDKIATNLKVQFSETVIAKLSELFEDESIRSDLIYATIDPLRLEKIPTNQDRSSMRWIRIIQTFLKISKDCESIKDRSLLFEIMFFQGKSYSGETLPHELRSSFKTVWKQYKNLQKNIDYFSYPLLIFFWESICGSLFLSFFEKFVNKCDLTCETMYHFCIKNEYKFDPFDLVKFEKSYLLLIDQLEALNLSTKYAGELFFSPPVKIDNDSLIAIDNSTLYLNTFVDKITPYKQPEDQEYFQMLRMYLFEPKEWMFTVLENCRSIPIQISSEILQKAFLKSHKPLNEKNIPPSPSIWNEAASKFKTLREKYPFSDTQAFSLLIEIIRLVTQQEKSILGQISTAITHFEGFCPVLKLNDIFFLFLYHPNISLDEIENLKKLRAESVFDPQKIQMFASNLATPCPDEEIREVFTASFANSLRSAFDPPIQHITDYCRISGVSSFGTIGWLDDARMTHAHRFTPVLPNASLLVFCHWLWMKAELIFIASLFDPAKGCARSWIAPFKGSFKGIADTIYSIDSLQKPTNDQEEFLFTAKQCYKDIFLEIVTENYKPKLFDPDQLAATGYIFNTPNGLSLVPQELQQIASDPQHYLSNATDSFTESCRIYFQKTLTKSAEPLNLQMSLPKTLLNHAKQEFNLISTDVFCHIEKEGLITLSILNISIPIVYPSETLENSTLFATIFRYHLLMLKSLVYKLLQENEGEFMPLCKAR